MAVCISDICENTKMAREFALLSNYETASVYYQGVVQQIHRLLNTIKDSTRKQRWQQVQQQVAAEYEHVRDVITTLQMFKGDNQFDRPINTRMSYEEPTRDTWLPMPLQVRDPDVWPPPTAAEHKPAPHVRPTRGPKKNEQPRVSGTRARNPPENTRKRADARRGGCKDEKFRDKKDSKKDEKSEQNKNRMQHYFIKKLVKRERQKKRKRRESRAKKKEIDNQKIH